MLHPPPAPHHIEAIRPAIIMPVIVHGHTVGMVRASTEAEARRKAFAMALGEVHRVELGDGRAAFVSW